MLLQYVLKAVVMSWQLLILAVKPLKSGVQPGRAAVILSPAVPIEVANEAPIAAHIESSVYMDVMLVCSCVHWASSAEVS